MVIKQKLPLIGLGIIVVILIAGGGVLFWQYQKSQQELKSLQANTAASQQAQTELRQLVSEVSKLIDVPTSEDPTVATVTSIDKLKDQQFFQKAKNGDKVLIYTSAKKAILYDPVAKKIIDVAPVNIGSASGELSDLAQPNASVNPIRVTFRNSTQTTGLAGRIEADLKKALPQVTTAGKDNAKAESPKTIVIAITEQGQADAAIVAQTLNATVGELPKDEVKPTNADILVLIGSDRSQ